MTAAPARLRTGWEESTPAGDTIVRRYLHHWAAVCEAFTSASGGRVLHTPRFAATDYGRPSGYFDAAVLLQPPDAETLDRVLDDIDAFFSDGHGQAMLWSAWPLPGAALGPRGWQLGGHPPLLIRPPAAVLPPPAAPAIDLRPVVDRAGLADWERVVVEGYPLTELQPFEPGRLAAPRILDDQRVRMWVGHDDQGAPVSIGTLFVEDDMASLALGATRPEARAGGHWRRHAVERLQTAPDVWMAGVFSDMSRPSAEAIGFVPILRLGLWILERPRHEGERDP